jgi:hypothetical protein
MKILNVSGGKKVKLPTLKLPKISILEEGADKKVAMYRAIILLLIFIILILLGEAYGESIKSGKAFGIEPAIEQIEAPVTEQEVVVEDKVEWVNGDKVTTKADGVVEVVPAEVFMESSIKPIKRFTQTYRGSRIDDKYFTLLDKYCSDEVLRTVIAISVAETGMGRDVENQSNFFGWFKGGKKNYDPSQEVMAKEICEGVENSYLNIGNDNVKARKYVGHDTTTWLRNYRWAYAQMEVK